jgi:hypothetical protein
MPPTLPRSKSTGSIRKSSRIADSRAKALSLKEAQELIDTAIKMQAQQINEAENKQIVASKNPEAVKPLNSKSFVEQDYTIILPVSGSSGIFTDQRYNFLKILNWEGKGPGTYPHIVDPPTSTLGIRKAFDDFNDVLKKDQGIKGEAVTLVSNTSDICKLSKGKNMVIETHREEKRKLQKMYKHMCFYCGRQIDVKNPDSPNPTLLNTQCDHIFPIASALISLDRNANLIYNFQSVHKTCNGEASKMDIAEIWNTIGTDKFKTLNPSRPWCEFTLNGLTTTTQVNTQEWCRGYLSILLNKLTIVNPVTQLIRKQVFENVIKSYQIYKDEVKLLMADDIADAVKLLSSLRTQSFGSPGNNIEITSIKKLNGDKKKYEAIFLVNGKQKTQKFGAEGMSDYTIHKDIDRRNRYISRHLKDLDTNDPTRAGYLSMFVLWNKPSFSASVKDYKTRLRIYNQTGKFPTNITGYSNLSNFGVNPVGQLARYKPVVLPGDILRKIDQEYILPPKKIAWQLKKYLPKRRQSFYLAQEFDNPDPYSEPIEFYPEDYNIAEYLELLAKYNTKPSILQHKDILAHIFINFKSSIDDPGTYLTQEQKLNKLKSKKYFIEVMKKLGFKLSFKNFSRDIKNPELNKFFDISETNFGTPANVINKTLYKKVKEQIKSGIKGRRWGAYDSGRLVQMYKQLGGKYSGTKKETPLERWYNEKWVNACKWPHVVPCGRSDMTNKMAYCRPSVKVTKNTPKTVQSLTQAQINKRCAIKEKTPLVRISGKLKV